MLLNELLLQKNIFYLKVYLCSSTQKNHLDLLNTQPTKAKHIFKYTSLLHPHVIKTVNKLKKL